MECLCTVRMGSSDFGIGGLPDANLCFNAATWPGNMQQHETEL